MPDGHEMTDYNHINNLDGTNKWPYGWPLKVVCVLPEDKCPSLKKVIEPLCGIGKYTKWASNFDLRKPLKLYSDESKALQAYFEPYYMF